MKRFTQFSLLFCSIILNAISVSVLLSKSGLMPCGGCSKEQKCEKEEERKCDKRDEEARRYRIRSRRRVIHGGMICEEDLSVSRVKIIQPRCEVEFSMPLEEFGVM